MKPDLWRSGDCTLPYVEEYVNAKTTAERNEVSIRVCNDCKLNCMFAGEGK